MSVRLWMTFYHTVPYCMCVTHSHIAWRQTISLETWYLGLDYPWPLTSNPEYHSRLIGQIKSPALCWESICNSLSSSSCVLSPCFLFFLKWRVKNVILGRGCELPGRKISVTAGGEQVAYCIRHPVVIYHCVCWGHCHWEFFPDSLASERCIYGDIALIPVFHSVMH
jgi:hypothetical protein